MGQHKRPGPGSRDSLSPRRSLCHGILTNPSSAPVQVDRSVSSIELIMKTSRLLEFDYDVPELVIDNQNIVRATPIASNKVLLTALKPGFATITASDPDKSIHIIGFAKIVGDISDGAMAVGWFFLVALLITGVLLFIFTRSIWLTILPLTCSLVAVIWQMGSLSLMGYSLDPMNILTPFLIFAIGVSHGVQKISAWRVEKEFGGHTPDYWLTRGVTSLEEVPRRSPMHGSRETIKKLLAPGVIALVSDTIGFLTILFIHIRIIQELAITASIGVAVIILTNLLLLPAMLIE